MARRQRKVETEVTEVLTNQDETVEVEQEVSETKTPVKAPAKAAPKRQVRVEKIDSNELIPCRSTQNKLIYVSKRTGERIEWSYLGEEQYVTYGELLSIRGQQKRFFEEGWLIVEDEEAVKQLNLKQEYDKLIDLENLDKFFSKSPTQMKNILEKLPRGYKKSIGVVAKERVESGELDSRNIIKLLEDQLEVDLKIFE